MGTVVNVYYVYFDPFFPGPGPIDIAEGTVTFGGEKILGIVAYDERLPESDFLRVPTSLYPGDPGCTGHPGCLDAPGFSARGWEHTEFARVDATRTTLTFLGSANTPGDQFRIFTAVPEPGSVALVFAGLAGLLIATRSKKRASSSH